MHCAGVLSTLAVLCVTVVVLVAVMCPSPSSMVEAKVPSSNHHQRQEKMLRLCLWTQCRSATSTKRCPDYLQQSARRKCKLEGSGEIGFYSKCCIYEEPFNLQKS